MVNNNNNRGTTFLLTLNLATLEYYKDILEYVTGLAHFQYLLCTEHIGQENKHYHMFIQYNQPKYLSIPRLHGAHIEKCFGSAQQNIAYCKCEDKKHQELGITYVLIDEIGEPKLKGGDWTIKRLRECDDESEIPAHLYRIKKAITEENDLDLEVDDIGKEIKVFYIQGPSGVGKTNRAKQIAKDYSSSLGTKINMIKYENGFYHGVGKAKIAIYDDFRDSHMKPSEFINLIDYNKHYMNIKNGSKLNNYNLIIITSVIPLKKIYRKMYDDEPKKQWERRIELIDMFPPEQVHLGGYPLGYRTEFNQLEEYEVTDNWDGTTVVIDN